MFGHDDLEFIGTREVHEAVPQLDTDSPRSSLANNPTKKQIESNNFSRCAELTPLFGSAEQALVLNVAWRKDALSSDEATASAIISTAVGNATGLITAILVHCCLRGYYRTGKYQLTLSPRAPTRAQQEKMKRSDGYVYLGDDGKLHYVIKRSFRKPIKGNIDVDKLSDEKKEETGRGEGGTTHVLKKLKATLARGYCEAGEGKPQCPPDWEAAFLEITHKRGHTYSGKTSTNPLYRTCKTLSSFGARFGAIISAYLGVENPNLKRILSFIMSDVFCIVFGLFGIAYFFIRDVVLKIPPNTKHTYDLTGLEGWSKYAKTALTLGTVIGQGVGGLILAISNAASASAVTVSSFSISFWGGVVGVASFVASLIFVPLINWISSKYTKDGKGILTSENKNKYRNNYTRSGLTLGAGFGALFGLIIGNWCFGLIMAATIFSALGALIGAIVLSAYGYRIHRKLHGPLPPGKTDNDEDNDNSFDYVTRCTASVFGFIGAAVVCAINPAMALLLVPIGSAIASTLGWGIGILIMKRARSLPGNEIEKKATTMPWTQRLNTGSNIGSVIGGCIGLAFGFAGFILAGPASLIFSVSLFGAIGAVVGGLMAVLYDKHSRQLICQALNPWASPPPPSLSRQSSPGIALQLASKPSQTEKAAIIQVPERKKISAAEDPLRAPLLPRRNSSSSPRALSPHRIYSDSNLGSPALFTSFSKIPPQTPQSKKMSGLVINSLGLSFNKTPLQTPQLKKRSGPVINSLGLPLPQPAVTLYGF